MSIVCEPGALLRAMITLAPQLTMQIPPRTLPVAVVEGKVSYGKSFTGSSSFHLEIAHIISAPISLAKVNHVAMLNYKDYTSYNLTISRRSQRGANIGWIALRTMT